MADSDDRLAPLRWLAIERAAGDQVGSNRLIEAGLEALLAGVDSPSLPMLAGLTRREEPEASELFDQVLEELGMVPELPGDEDQALLTKAHWWAGLILDGKLDPAEGADLIWWRVAMLLDYPEQLQGIVEGARAASGLADGLASMDEIKSDIIRAARELPARREVAGPERS